MKKLFLTLTIILSIYLVSNAQNNCLTFDGVDDYIESNGTMTILPAWNYTLQAWVKIDVVEEASFVSFGTRNLALAMNSSGEFVSIAYGSSTVIVNSGFILEPGIWYHLLTIFMGSNNDNEIRQYVDGVLINTGTGGHDERTRNLYVGKGYVTTTTDMYFDGQIDEVNFDDTFPAVWKIREDMFKSNYTGEVDYPLDETSGTTADNIGAASSGMDGTLYGGLSFSSDAIPSPTWMEPKRALKFDGASGGDYITCPTDNNAYSSLTIKAWINTQAATDHGRICFKSKNGYLTLANSCYALLVDDNNKPKFSVDGTNLTAPDALPHDEWHHIAGVFSGSSSYMKLYVDGILVASETSGIPSQVPAPTIDYPLVIGASYSDDAPNYHFDGYIDELVVDQYTESEKTIRSYMCSMDQGSLLRHHYHFDSAPEDILPNFASTGSDYDGTLRAMESADRIDSEAFNVWLDVTTTDWSTANCWSRGVAPGSSDNVGIFNYYGSSDVSPVITSSSSCNLLVIDYSGSLTINSNTLTVDQGIFNLETLTVGENGTLMNNSSGSYLYNNDDEASIEISGTCMLENYATTETGPSFDINETGTVTIEGDCTNDGSFTINSSSSGTGSLIVHGTASGEVTAERYVSAGKWHYVASPVDAVNLATWMPLNNIATETGGQYQFYRWDEDTQYWIYYGYTGTEPENFGDTEFVDARGYCLTTTSDGELSFTGTPITTDVSYSVSNDGNSCHLLGNPFTSTIAITNDGQANDNFLADNTGILDENYQAIYIWNEGESYSYGRNDYSVVCNTGFLGQGSGSTIDQDFVEPGQAFMVKVKQAGTIYFNQDIRKHGDADYYKSKESWPGVELSASAENTSNATSIAFNSEMTHGLDPSFDAGKLKANNELSVYTLLVEDNGHQFAVQALPDQNIEDMIVSVGTDIAEPIQVEFSIYQENLDNYSIVLEDRQTGTFTNLRRETYATEITQSGTGRFYLHFKDATAIGEITPETKISLRYLDGRIQINNPELENGNISLVNVGGQVLDRVELDGNYYQEFTIQQVSGIYIISIQTDKTHVSRKVFIK